MNSIIKSLNLTDGAVLTLEKMADRMEFEALALIPESRSGDCSCLLSIYLNSDCPLNGACPEFTIDPCDCKGPVGYINCHPYK